MSTTSDMCGWLARQDGPRSARRMRDAAAPEADMKSVRATVAQLVAAKKLIPAGQAPGERKGTMAYLLAPGGLVDRRFKATQRKPRAKVGIAVGKALNPPRVPVDVSADVARFLSAGGRIQRLPRYAVSRPFKRLKVAA